jgi:nucleoside-diphosphate-sugar epimerase
MIVAITGGAGYVGATLAKALLDRGHEVRAVDSLLHGQQAVADGLTALGVDVQVGDVTDPAALDRLLAGADAVVHLAAIVGDPACARDPERAHEVNVGGTEAVIDAVVRNGVGRIVFASTCSNYGRMADPTVPIDETGELRPVSLYAEQKVAMEQLLLGGRAAPASATCLRFATVYGVADRMRFDLTVNEFTRDLWADRPLEVFGELFWRPYVHVQDAAQAVALVLEADESKVAGQVFNAGTSTENYRKLDLAELITKHLGRGEVSYVSRQEDPRDYKVSFERIKEQLGFAARFTVPDGIAEVAAALDEGRFPDPFAPIHKN